MINFSERRARLKQDCSLFVIAGNDALQSSADMAYPFVQDATFYYFTGISEPGWRLVCDFQNDKTWLIGPTISEHGRLFDGALSTKEASNRSGVDVILNEAEGRDLLRNLSSTHQSVFSLDGHPHQDYFQFIENPARGRLWAELQELFENVHDCRKIVAKHRAIKDGVEIAATERAVNISIEGFNRMKEAVSRGATHEYELEAILNADFRSTGGGGHAYPPIVAGGMNACTLHYAHNNDQLPKNGLVLIDAGASVEGYAADITRTYAVGQPSKREIAVHEAVQKAHVAIIALLRPGLSLMEYQENVDKIMKDALRSLGLLKSEDDYRRYFPHSIGHGLGLDVHESLGYDTLQPGMIMTVEPGIYIPEEGIGVRIEDDILITVDGHRNLSAALPIGL
ncbi:hypothetical protein CL689_03240 [Candidatus Saccharibacteria bacterium]|nr:hypothetical protein [Candidatus Saccharibacteria bacterium]MBJ58189.1 hypothetical protein [Candidatus Saccharibacteria bacterium]MBQ69055.1 hypothetical protein [Candidatus Saccharibacteria bacterium]|tara:strand:+ start:264 stop:1451 length:1188 start_codon:yes stop_codon:yes gene_type:complete